MFLELQVSEELHGPFGVRQLLATYLAHALRILFPAAGRVHGMLYREARRHKSLVSLVWRDLIDLVSSGHAVGGYDCSRGYAALNLVDCSLAADRINVLADQSIGSRRRWARTRRGLGLSARRDCSRAARSTLISRRR